MKSAFRRKRFKPGHIKNYYLNWLRHNGLFGCFSPVIAHPSQAAWEAVCLGEWKMTHHHTGLNLAMMEIDTEHGDHAVIP